MAAAAGKRGRLATFCVMLSGGLGSSRVLDAGAQAKGQEVKSAVDELLAQVSRAASAPQYDCDGKYA